MGKDKSFDTGVGLIGLASLFLMWGAIAWYPLLDDYPVYCYYAFLFVAGILVLASAEPLSQHSAFLRKILVLAGIVLVLFPIFLILNAVLDHLPPVQAETRVIRKSYNKGKAEHHYHLIVSPSWREGQDQEKIDLDRGDWYDKVEVGDLVKVAVNRGKFGLPWGARLTNPPPPD